MRLLLPLMLLALGAACAYDPLGIESAREADAGSETDASDSGDEPEVDLTIAASVEPGCASGTSWCNRTPMFRSDFDATPEWPGYLNAVSATSSASVWVAGHDFQILRWSGETWIQEHKSFGEVRALWMDSSGRGIAVGSDLGSPRKRRVLARSQDGIWTPLALPVRLEEGELLDVWALATDEGDVRFWAATGGELLIESNLEGVIFGSDLPVRVDAVVGVEDGDGNVELYLGGQDGIGRRDASGDVQMESFTAKAKNFFLDSDAVVAVGGREIWSRDPEPTPGWLKTTPARVHPLAACRGAISGAVPRVAASGATIYQTLEGSWVEEKVRAPDDAVITACATLPDGSGWAVGYVIASDGTGRLPGFVLEQKAR